MFAKSSFSSIARGSLAAVLLCLAAASFAVAQVESSLPPNPLPAGGVPGAEEEGVETLTHGPIHEAFANPTDLDPTEIPSAPNQPPADVAEEPPEFMPEGAIWIPGYWLWDDERDQYIWVTGAARVPPPNMKWVPGYYTEINGAWQRVNGFWVSTEVPAVEYRAAPPPETLEVGPSSPAPADDYFWIPGNWNYHDTGYRWQAGYWAPYQQNWIWSPSRWTWTPAGYVYCPGFWDYRMAYRGQIFAPIYFQQPVYARPGWAYRPWCAIPTNNLFIHLWIRPRWNCYYFGNYYGARYANSGFVAWANVGVNSRQRYMYDPFFSYARVHYHRQGVDYIGRVQGWNRYYNDHNDLRPPRTWREQQAFLASNGRQRMETQLIAAPVTEIARRNDNALRITRLDDQARRTQQQSAERLREFNTQRRRVERDSQLVDARVPSRDRDDGRDFAKGRGDGNRGDGNREKGTGDKGDGNKGDRNDDKRGDGKRGDGPNVARPNANPGRGSPRLDIPADLPGGDRRVVRNEPGDNRRDDQQRGDDQRGDKQRGDKQRDDNARRDNSRDDDDGAKRNPPPQPRPGRVASDAGKSGPGNAGKIGLDDDRGGKGAKGGKAIERVESTPPARPGNNVNPGRGPAAREPGTVVEGTPNDRRPNPGRPDTTPKVDNTPDNDRGDRSPVAGSKGKAGNRGSDAARGPDLGDSGGGTVTIPPGDRPNRTPENPSAGRSGRGDQPGVTLPNPGRGDGGRPSFRPDAGSAAPAVTLPSGGTGTPPSINPNRAPQRGNIELPGSRPESPRTTPRPDAGRTRETQPNPGQPGNVGGNRPTFNARGSNPGGGGESPRINIPDTRGRDSNPRPSNQNKGGSSNRGSDSGSRGNEGASRSESFRPSTERSPTAAMPRFEPRIQAREMPRVETPTASRSMPRVEAPRENRSPPRIETRSRSENSSPARTARPEPRADRGSSRPAAEVASGSESAKGKSKGRDRD